MLIVWRSEVFGRHQEKTLEECRIGKPYSKTTQDYQEKGFLSKVERDTLSEESVRGKS